MRWLWLLLALVASAWGGAPALASDFVRAPFMRCAVTAQPGCPATRDDRIWVALRSPAALSDLSPGWQLLVDQTRFANIRVELDTPGGTQRIDRTDETVGHSLGNNLRFDVPVAGRDVQALRIGFEPGSDIGLMRSIKAASPAALADYEQGWLLVASLVGGLMLCALIYSLFLFSWLRTPFQRYYVIWVAAALGYTLLWSGVIFLVAPGFPGNAVIRLDAFLASVIVGIGTVFFFALMEEDATTPELVTAGRWAAAATLSGGVLAGADPLVPIWLGDKILNLTFIACNLTVLAGVIVAVQRRSRMVWFYLAGWLPALLIFNLRIARNFGLLPQSDLIDYATFVGLGFQAMMLSLAIADRVRQLTRDFAAADAERHALRSEVSSDALTGVRNRAFFQRRLAAVEDVGEPVDMVIVDVDYLKDTNDFAGHDAGDRLLVETAARLHAAADCDECVARLGGDEFAVLLTGDQRSRLQNVLDSVRQSAVVTLPNGQILPLSMSAGHAAWEPEHGPPGRLFKEADLALYQAKAAGRAGWRTYDTSMRDDDEARRRMILEARTALTRGEFFLAYQPIFDLKTNTLCANEVLLRWRHPSQGVLTPSQFAAALDEPTLLTELQDLVLDKALESVASDPSLGRVGVNFVASQLQGIAAAERIFDKMASRRLPADRLIVEVRESVMLGRVLPGSPIEQCLDRLRWAGVSVALDDFGTGGASLAHLRALPTDILKIDVSLIAQITHDKATARIVQSVIDLAHGFGRMVVAEGIETELQLAALKRYGCDAGQGHLLARPIEVVEDSRLKVVAIA